MDLALRCLHRAAPHAPSRRDPVAITPCSSHRPASRRPVLPLVDGAPLVLPPASRIGLEVCDDGDRA